jgi:hypothetical protein
LCCILALSFGSILAGLSTLVANITFIFTFIYLVTNKLPLAVFLPFALLLLFLNLTFLLWLFLTTDVRNLLLLCRRL